MAFELLVRCSFPCVRIERGSRPCERPVWTKNVRSFSHRSVYIPVRPGGQSTVIPTRFSMPSRLLRLTQRHFPKKRATREIDPRLSPKGLPNRRQRISRRYSVTEDLPVSALQPGGLQERPYNRAGEPAPVRFPRKSSHSRCNHQLSGESSPFCHPSGALLFVTNIHGSSCSVEGLN